MAVNFTGPEWTSYDVGGSLEDVAEQLHAMNEAAQAGWDGAYEPTAWRHDNHIEDVRIDAHLRVHMPHWTEYAKGSDAERAEWDRYIEATRVHEQGHLDLIYQYLQHADTALIGKSDHAAHKEWEHIKHTLDQAEKHYDHQTSHGRHTGTNITVPAHSG